MPRIRSIKPAFWDSEDVAATSLRGRLLYIAMWNWADDYGIGEATPLRLLGFAFPHDDLPVSEIPTLCEEIAERFGVVFYRHDGRAYYYIPSWEEHQRTEKKAKQRVPFPPGHETTGTPVEESKAPESPTQGGGRSGAGSRKKEVGSRKEELLPDADASSVAESFAIFWDTYDKKTGKKASEAKFKLALKKRGVTAPMLIEAARQYVAWKKSEGEHPKFTKDPAHWLNGEHWNDERASKKPTQPDGTRDLGLPHVDTLEEPPEDATDEEIAAWYAARRERTTGVRP